MVTYVKGSATEPVGDGPKIIAHVCNDIGRWGAGFVLSLNELSILPRANYLRAYQNEVVEWGNSRLRLGSVFLVDVKEDLYVANMIAQHGVRSANNPVPLNYEALEICLDRLARDAEFLNATVHMPRIGCGLAGGKWDVVESIINRVLTLRDIDVTVYDL
ncbi:hypothetical protein SEA_SHAM_158 [Streptomyces phage Sham]|nr:hypothetical protein SEA_SHAM_158 [Streptomyces phage Sham]